jgi:hypothetical protein
MSGEGDPIKQKCTAENTTKDRSSNGRTTPRDTERLRPFGSMLNFNNFCSNDPDGIDDTASSDTSYKMSYSYWLPTTKMND